MLTCDFARKANQKFIMVVTIYSQQPLHEKDHIRDYARKDFYWGIADRQKMRDFLDLARKEGYVAARSKFDFKVEKPAKFRQYVDGFDRADFHFLLPLDEQSVILDLGSGYGNITIPLARYYKKVIAVDTSLELLEFIRVRAESEGLTNIEYVHADPFEYCNLPFNDEVFDAVVLSGVLEWVGAAKLDENPFVLQMKFLAQIRRVLKGDGFLYMAIENRWFPDYFYRDPHSKLRYTAHLPRFIANGYAKFMGQQDGYRTYIYGYFGYCRMLKKVGFSDLKFNFPFPSYRNPLAIWPENNAASRVITQADYFRPAYTSKWRILINLLSKIHLAGLFLSSFMIIAPIRESGKSPSLFRLIQRIRPVAHEGDYVIKVVNADEYFASFLLFHATETVPYASARVARKPTGGEDDVLIEFVGDHE